MKAVRINNQNLEVKEERGAFTYYINAKGKMVCELTANLTIVDCDKIDSKEAAKRAKKLNRANFMSAEEYAKSDIAKMDKYDFEKMRERDAYNTISW